MPYFDGTDPCWLPDQGSTISREWRLRKAQFGDGYQQRILDGINPLDSTFGVSFYRTEAQLIAMDDYLIARQGASFPYVDQEGDSYTVFCDKWQISWDVRRRRDPVTFQYEWYGTLSAEFNKANGVQIGPIT